MRWADRCRAIVAATLCIAGSTFATAADQSSYGKVDTFEPGKKYNCVPSADRKGWDCTQTGKATANDAAPTPHRDEPAAAVSASPKQETAPAAAPPHAATTPRTGKLPSYLLAPGASDSATSAPIARHAPAAVFVPAPAAPPPPQPAPVVHTSTNPQPAPAVAAPPPTVKPAPPAEPKPAAAIAEKPASHLAVAPAPAPAPAHPRARASDSHSGSSGFLALPGDEYVIELTHAASENGLSAPAPPRGNVYELHLRQNGADVWLLVWGSFEDVSAARAARGELPADAHAGWPRRIAPLQAEVRRAQE